MVKERNKEPSSLPNLMVPRAEAERKIKAQIKKGLEIKQIRPREDLEIFQAELEKWSDYNYELLTRLFDNTSIAEEYRRSAGMVITAYRDVIRELERSRRSLDDRIDQLESILERLELIPERGEQPTLGQSLSLGSDIFIVHGHDEGAKQSVARFIEKLGLNAVILHEQPSAGRTIIEKFEDYSNVGFAVVLLTPDDVGGTQDRSEEGRSRARQNVIFELGYFVGRLGRGRVCILHKGHVEIPSDLQGVLYVPMDTSGGWQLTLAREIKQAGIEFNSGKLF